MPKEEGRFTMRDSNHRFHRFSQIDTDYQIKAKGQGGKGTKGTRL